MNTTTVRTALLALALAGAAAGAFALPLPPDSGALNVRAFGAKGDGKADDTAAIRAALLASQVDQGRGFWPARIVYLPAGTYRVSDTLFKRSIDGRYLNSFNLHGEGRDLVRIKLDDAAAGYGDAAQPKAVIYTSSTLIAGGPTAGGKDYAGKGEGNEAYGNYIEDLTVDVGKGNPGAVAIDYIGNNAGAIRHVRLVGAAGSGLAGLSMERKWPGPSLVSDLEVDGFARGVTLRWSEYSVTMEKLRLSGQSEVALRNDGNSLALHDVQISNAAVPIQNLAPTGLIVADGLLVKMPRNAAAWVDNRGYFTFRNAQLSPAPAGGTAGLAAGQDGVYFGANRLDDFDAGWRLPIEATPAPWQPPFARWANVSRFGAAPDSGLDAAPGIRAAIASGAEVLYFPSGRYTLSDSIDVPSTVRRIVGMYSSFSVDRRLPSFARETGMFRVASSGEPLTIERLTMDNTNRGGQLGISHSGSRTLVLRDLVGIGVGTIDRSDSGGPLFMENSGGGYVHVAGPAGVWLRQFNSEGPNVRIGNFGSPLWLLGVKTEQNCTVLENQAGAQSEVLGGLVYLVNPVAQPRPAFINHAGGRLFAAYAESAYVAGAVYQDHLVQLAEDGSRQSAVTADQLPARGRARIEPGRSLPRAPAPNVAEDRKPRRTEGG